MSNYYASSTVTATIKRILQQAVRADVPGAIVTTVRPDVDSSKLPEVGLNLYMLQSTISPVYTNVDLNNRNSKDDSVKQKQTGLNLYYVISCYGNDEELEPERLMCSAIRAIISNAILYPETIRETLNDPKYAFLADSNLDEQSERITIVPSKKNFEEMSKIWSAYFQPPRALSFLLEAATVMLDSAKGASRALPVRGIATYSTPNQPRIEQVISDAGANQPFMATSKLTIRGTQLDAKASDKPSKYSSDPKIRRQPLDRGQPQVKIGEVLLTPQNITETEIQLDLSYLKIDERNALHAGVQSLQVVYPILPLRAPSQPKRVVSSNTMPFILCSTVKEMKVEQLEDYEDGLYSARLHALVDFTVGAKQQVSLVLNERSQHNPEAYIFAANSRSDNTNELVFSIRDVKKGEYLVRIQIDGAESPLEVDTNPESQTFEQYVRPVVTIG